MCTNENSRAYNGRPASTERSIEDDRESFVGDDVAQEKRDQNPVLAALE